MLLAERAGRLELAWKEGTTQGRFKVTRSGKIQVWDSDGQAERVWCAQQYGRHDVTSHFRVEGRGLSRINRLKAKHALDPGPIRLWKTLAVAPVYDRRPLFSRHSALIERRYRRSEEDSSRSLSELRTCNLTLRNPFQSHAAPRHHWFKCTTLAGGKPLKDVLLAAE